MASKTHRDVQTKTTASRLMAGTKAMIKVANSKGTYVRTFHDSIFYLTEVGYTLHISVDQEKGVSYVDIA